MKSTAQGGRRPPEYGRRSRRTEDLADIAGWLELGAGGHLHLSADARRSQRRIGGDSQHVRALSSGQRFVRIRAKAAIVMSTIPDSRTCVRSAARPRSRTGHGRQGDRLLSFHDRAIRDSDSWHTPLAPPNADNQTTNVEGLPRRYVLSAVA